jgi:FkbM family methyltransferase
MSQSGEDRDILKHMAKNLNVSGKFPLEGPTNVILEIGALDGLLFSTSYFFEHYLNWKAVHFEASRRNFESLISNRPRSLNVHVAGCAEAKNLTFVDDGAVGGIVDAMSDFFKSRFHPDLTQKLTYEVECAPLSKYLSIFGIRRIEIFILDTEGNELDVLLGFDLREIQVHYFIIEEDHSNVPKEETIRKMLADQGFRFVGPFGDNRNGLYENEKWV